MDEHRDLSSGRAQPESLGLAAPAMAYVPWQEYTQALEPDQALKAGTLFPELDKPFLAAGRCPGRE